MKKVLILTLLFLPTIAQAKVALCEKGCTPMDNDQVYAIKGFLYEVVQSQEPSVKKQVIPKFARCLVWLDKIHKDKKTHVITRYKTEDASLIKASIQFIIDVAMDRYSEMKPEKTIARWTLKGSQVIAEYAEKVTKDKNGIKHTEIKWKLELVKE
jgi:CRISPR/Cas system endoribonuclease Cas6 (RAMP superfamily)